jgi:CheY-like chemotaxis protein
VLGDVRPLPDADAGRPAPRLPARSVRLAGARILLVEDNDINREFAVELLRSEGIEVDEAADGQEAVERVQRKRYDAVLMDIQMPVMDGLQAARRIRGLVNAPGGARFASLPIIAMTALAMASDAQASRDAGMNDHITKPIDPDHLLATLSRWLRVAGDPAAEPPLPTLADEAARLPDDLRALTHLDAADGVHRIGGRAEPYRRQLRRFRAQYADAITELGRLSEQARLTEAEAYCHALKGVAGNIGARALFACISEIDDRLKQGSPPSAALLDAAETRLRDVLADIDSLGGEESAFRSSAPAPLSPALLRDLVTRLKQALESDLGAAEALLDQLGRAVAGTPLAPRVEAIAGRVDRFELEAALAQIETFPIPGEASS